jgi:hypothetical protein
MMEARPILSDGDKEHIWIYQDEAVYHSNDFQNVSFWLKSGEHVLKKKGQGQLIMVSAFVCKQYGNLALPEDLVEANARLPSSEHLEFTDSHTIIYPTSKKGGDDYWNAKQMLHQVRTHICASDGV